MSFSGRYPIIALSIFLARGATAADWNYLDIEGWGKIDPICNVGTKQSPIDFKAADIQKNEDADIKLTDADYSQKSGWFHNNGHTVHWSLAEDEVKPTFSPPNLLEEVFYLSQCDFHWGKCDDAGSEHKVEGMSYPLEMHCVHFNRKYDGEKSWLSHADGAAVLIFMFKLGTENLHMDSIFSNVPLSKTSASENSLLLNLETNDPISKTDLPEPQAVSFDINAALLDRVDTTKVAWYEGSLTTPTCNEAVTFVMFRDAIEISPDQLANMRKAVLGANEGFNYRPTQNLNNRTLYKNFDEDLPAAPGDSVCANDVKPTPRTGAASVGSPTMLVVFVALVGILASSV